MTVAFPVEDVRIHIVDAAGLGDEVPEGPDRIRATRGCICVDLGAAGRARVTLSDDSVPDFMPPPTFEGILETPSRQVSVTTAAMEPLAVAEVRSGSTWIRIWTDRPPMPDDVLIVLAEARRAD